MPGQGDLARKVRMIDSLSAQGMRHLRADLRHALAEAQWTVPGKVRAPLQSCTSAGLVQILHLKLVTIDAVQSGAGIWGCIRELRLVEIVEAEGNFEQGVPTSSIAMVTESGIGGAGDAGAFTRP